MWIMLWIDVKKNAIANKGAYFELEFFLTNDIIDQGYTETSLVPFENIV
jgi:hypothetical protein